jgi:hypothetical protein
MLRDALVTGLVVVLSMFLADGADVFSLTWNDGRLYLAAALAAVIRTALTWLDPRQTAYGRGAE